VVTYEGVEYPGRHPALVSQELFGHVQGILDASGVSGERRRTHDHYLKGTLWCNRCQQRGRQHRLIITRATGRRGTDYFYFLCRGRQEGACDLPYLPMEHVEDAVLRHWGANASPRGSSSAYGRTCRPHWTR
jgi:site-specific DNA recombinase